MRLTHQLYTQVELSGRGEVYAAPTALHLSEFDVLEPDILVLNVDRLEAIGPAKVDGPPDLVVEILSPWTSRVDRHLKHERYERAGVSEYWIVDPEKDTLEQHVLEEGRFRLVGAHEERVCSLAIDGVVVDLVKVWRGDRA